MYMYRVLCSSATSTDSVVRRTQYEVTNYGCTMYTVHSTSRSCIYIYSMTSAHPRTRHSASNYVFVICIHTDVNITLIFYYYYF